MSASAPLLGAKPTSRILAIGAVIVRPLGQPRQQRAFFEQELPRRLGGFFTPLMVGNIILGIVL